MSKPGGVGGEPYWHCLTLPHDASRRKDIERLVDVTSQPAGTATDYNPLKAEGFA